MIKIKKLKFNYPFIIKTILIIFIIGIIIGTLSTAKIKAIDYKFIKSNKNSFTIFFNSFTYNYWYFFLLWICGFFSFGFIIIYFIIFFKGFTIGTIFFVLLKSNGIPSFIDILKIIFPEIIFIIPLFVYLSYYAISYNLNKKSIYQNIPNNYINKLIFSTGGIILYAIIIAINNNFINI